MGGCQHGETFLALNFGDGTVDVLSIAEEVLLVNRFGLSA